MHISEEIRVQFLVLLRAEVNVLVNSQHYLLLLMGMPWQIATSVSFYGVMTQLLLRSSKVLVYRIPVSKVDTEAKTIAMT